MFTITDDGHMDPTVVLFLPVGVCNSIVNIFSLLPLFCDWFFFLSSVCTCNLLSPLFNTCTKLQTSVERDTTIPAVHYKSFGTSTSRCQALARPFCMFPDHHHLCTHTHTHTLPYHAHRKEKERSSVNESERVVIDGSGRDTSMQILADLGHTPLCHGDDEHVLCSITVSSDPSLYFQVGNQQRVSTDAMCISIYAILLNLYAFTHTHTHTGEKWDY